MFCSNCGIENADGSAFCKNCGIALAKNPEAAPRTQMTTETPDSQPAPVYQAPTPAYKPPLSSNPAINVVKTIASSALFLTATIAFSVQLLLKFLGVFKGAAITRIAYKIMNAIGARIPYEYYAIIDKIDTLGRAPIIIIGLLSLIPAILVCIGLWITYASAKNRTSDTIKTSGLTIIKVSTIIQLVGFCLSALLVGLLTVLATIMAGEVGNSDAMVVIVIFVVIAAMVHALQIIYCAKVIKSVNAAKQTIFSGVAADKASRFVAVMAFIGAAGSLFLLITNFLTAAATITSLICFGILIFKYNDSMRKLIFKTNR